MIAPEGHGAGDGQHRVQAPEQDAIQQQLADARRQRQRCQVATQQRQLLAPRLERTDVLPYDGPSGYMRGYTVSVRHHHKRVQKSPDLGPPTSCGNRCDGVVQTYLQQRDGVVHGGADGRLHGLAQEAGDAARLLGGLQQLHLCAKPLAALYAQAAALTCCVCDGTAASNLP